MSRLERALCPHVSRYHDRIAGIPANTAYFRCLDCSLRWIESSPPPTRLGPFAPDAATPDDDAPANSTGGPTAPQN